MISAESSWRISVASVFFTACGWPEGLPSDSSYADDGGGAEEGTTTTTDESSSTAASTDGGVITSTGEGEDTSTSEPIGFIQDPDGGSRNLECDIWEDDCERGEKCMPWANDGGNAWNATKCTPIARAPNAPGESCTVVDNGVSGIDDCEAGAMCWNVDAATNAGECVAFCDGPQQNPTCPDPSAPCAYLGESTPFMLCLPYCDPLVQDCGAESGCYPSSEGFYCEWDGSGEGGGAGSPCEYLNTCDPGLFCARSGTIPDCFGTGCCSPFCDAADPETPCPAGLECIPWYEKGQAPAQFESVGGCMEGG
jgi:hypothetical protein